MPELTADGKAEAETVTQSAENDPKTQVRTMAPGSIVRSSTCHCFGGTGIWNLSAKRKEED